MEFQLQKTVHLIVTSQSKYSSHIVSTTVQFDAQYVQYVEATHRRMQSELGRMDHQALWKFIGLNGFRKLQSGRVQGNEPFVRGEIEPKNEKITFELTNG